MSSLYVDHNATTPLHPEVVALLREASSGPANPSSVHAAGRAARLRLDRARARVAQCLGCEPREVVFTASGSEANALAVLGAFRSGKGQRRRIVTTAIEHPALLAAVAVAEREGAECVRIAPDPTGRISESAVLEALTPQTLLCSVMWANNESGVLQPVSGIARACRQRGILFHTDAVQAAGKLPVTLREVDADLLSLSAHKFGGPAGVGVLIVRKGVPLEPLVPGHQEDGHRGGTQNVVWAEACALALELSTHEVARHAAALGSVRDRFEARLLAALPEVVIHGREVPRVSNTSSVRFGEQDGEALLIALDLEGIAASMGAACASGTLKPSHVLTAMGLSQDQAKATLRFSFGRAFAEPELERLVEAIATAHGRLSTG